MDHNYCLEYENVRIRPLQKKDIETIRKWRNNPANCLYLRKLPHISREMQEQWYERYLLEQDEITFAIDEIGEMQELVGSVSLYNFEKNRVEFGKILVGNEKAHGKKVGIHATRAVLEIAFNQLHMHKVILKCYEENIAALKVYTQAGFRKDSEQIIDGKKEYTMYIERTVYFSMYNIYKC